MPDKKREKKGYGQPAIAALCSAGLFCVLYLFKGLYPFGNGSIMTTDLYSQYVPLLYRFYDVVSGEKNLFLDFSISAGANLYVDTINEVLNPFNYILLLFGRERIYLAVNVLLICYGAAAAAAADLLLCRLWEKDRRWNLVLSLCYALSGYTMYNYQIIKWMYFPVLFPLFLLALRRLFLEKKGGWYAALLGYQLMLSVQLGFMTLLFTLFCSGIYVWGQRKESRRALAEPGRLSAEESGTAGAARSLTSRQERRETLCRLGLYTVCGLLLSCAVLVPNALLLLHSSRAGANLSYFGVMKRHGLDDLFERLFQIANPALAAAAVWAIGQLGRGKRADALRNCGIEAGRKGSADALLECGTDAAGKQPVTGKLRVCRQTFAVLPPEGKFWIRLNIFLWLTVLLEPANLLWHMGSYVCFPVRYGYMVLISGCCLVKWLLTVCGGGTCAEKRNVPFLGGAAAFGALALLLVFRYEERLAQAFGSLAISSTCPKETLIVCGIWVLLFLAALCAMACGRRRRFWTGGAALVCGLAFGSMIFLPRDSALRRENEEAYERMNAQRREAEAEEEGSFCREEDDAALPLNAALVNGSNSLSGYIPTADGRYQEAMEKLGYLTPWVSTYSVGGTRISDALLAVKKQGAERVFAGVVFEKTAEELQLCGNTVLERQQELAQAITDKKLLEPLDKTEADKYLYLDCGIVAGSVSVLVNGEAVEIPEENAAESPNRLIGLGLISSGEMLEVCVMDKSGNALSLGNMELGALDAAGWEETLDAVLRDGTDSAWKGSAGAGDAGTDSAEEDSAGAGDAGTDSAGEGSAGAGDAGADSAEEDSAGAGDAGTDSAGESALGAAIRARALTAEQLNVDVRKGQLTVRLEDACSGETLFLPFAALEGWRCENNGEAVDITPVFGGFLGITLQDGSNEVVLRFNPPGWKAGLMLTLCGVLGLFLSAGPKAPQRRPAGAVTAAVSGLFWILFAAGLILIYVIPAAGLLGWLAVKVTGFG